MVFHAFHVVFRASRASVTEAIQASCAHFCCCCSLLSRRTSGLCGGVAVLFRTSGRAMRCMGQGCRASWGPRVAWDSLTLQGFVGATHYCMGLTDSHIRSVICREKSVGGSGCSLERAIVWAARHRPIWHWLRLHQFPPLPVSRRSNLAPASLRRFTPDANPSCCEPQAGTGPHKSACHWCESPKE